MRFVKLLRIPLFTLSFVFPTMLISLIMAIALDEKRMIAAFALPMLAALLLCPPVLISIKKDPLQLYARDGFFVVSLSWILISLWGALPYLLAGAGISWTDAVFESSCSFATTGATTLADIEALPYSLLFWRSISHWTGGMGIILLTVALLPLLGVGGFQLIKAEAPGPEKEKITPKITVTAKVLWALYAVLTFIVFILYLIGGMSVFDAVCHAFTTLATGGVSTKNAGIAYYDSAYIDTVATVFMLLAGINFNLYYRMLRGKFREAIDNTELRVYIALFVIASLVIAFDISHHYDSWGTSLRFAAFQTASFITTAGIAITSYDSWPALSQTILFILMFLGGCSGSTAGGIKIVRYAVLYKQAGNEFRRMIYPRGVFSIKLNNRMGRKDLIYGVAAFMFLYFILIALTTLATAASGFDVLTSLSASLSVLGNVGTGFGAIGPGNNYAFFPAHIKWLYSFLMITGRLELWTILVLFQREYWSS
ncbi:MAG: TrkH family potassium uptake protein [Spirochaetaceae bacterium]|jgi:trk system potassium uptake protein TrkH|nr:TrkH family potassium uptake protein [Spirochaetaceae bacterium]